MHLLASWTRKVIIETLWVSSERKKSSTLLTTTWRLYAAIMEVTWVFCAHISLNKYFAIVTDYLSAYTLMLMLLSMYDDNTWMDLQMFRDVFIWHYVYLGHSKLFPATPSDDDMMLRSQTNWLAFVSLLHGWWWGRRRGARCVKEFYHAKCHSAQQMNERKIRLTHFYKFQIASLKCAQFAGLKIMFVASNLIK